VFEIFVGESCGFEYVAEAFSRVTPEIVVVSQAPSQSVQDLYVRPAFSGRVNDPRSGENNPCGSPIVTDVVELKIRCCRKDDVCKLRRGCEKEL